MICLECGETMNVYSERKMVCACGWKCSMKVYMERLEKMEQEAKGD